MNLLKIKNIDLYLVIAILIAFMLVLSFSDTSNMPSANETNITLKPCSLVDGDYVEASSFNLGEASQICGEVLSNYMPLELRYYITNLDTDRTILFFEYIKITTHNFTINLPNNLETGKYKFELKFGNRKNVAETYFTILP